MTIIPRITLFGRVNVGKSTLFNRLTETSAALVSRVPGTTRDRRYGLVDWRGEKFELIDAGGAVAKPQNVIERLARDQLVIALNQADLLALVVDGVEGLTSTDIILAKTARQTGRPIILIINKIDGPKKTKRVPEFAKLGLESYAVSAVTGGGTHDLLDAILKKLPKKLGQPMPDLAALPRPPIRLALIGKTNVGKSSLVNALLKEERVIVSPEAHTTSEPQDIALNYQGQEYVLTDTAGLRRKNKRVGLEITGAAKSEQAIKAADVSILTLDATSYRTAQDSRLAGLLTNVKCGVIIALNKWDIVPDKDAKTMDRMRQQVKTYFPFLSWAPIIFVSSKTNYHLDLLLNTAREVLKEREKFIADEELKTWFKQAITKHLPARGKGTKQPVLYGIKQIKISPPVFEIVKDRMSVLHFSYLRFLENRLREQFGFVGTPIKITTRAKLQ